MLINQLIEESHETSKAKGWWEPPEREIGTLLMLAVSELSEALEEWRKGTDLQAISWNGTKPLGFPVELADCIIRIADLCGRHEIPIEEALIEKMSYNRTRPHRHGGKIA